MRLPDELRLRVHVPHSVLRKPLVQTVECGSQEAPEDPHRDEETQVHSRPQVTFFIRVRALRGGERKGEGKTVVPMRTGREGSGERRQPGRGMRRGPGAESPPEAAPTLPVTSLWRSERSSRVKQEIQGVRDKVYLKLAKVQQPGELEGTPTSKLNPRAEEVEGEGGRHGTEELGTGDKNKDIQQCKSDLLPDPPRETYCSTLGPASCRSGPGPGTTAGKVRVAGCPTGLLGEPIRSASRAPGPGPKGSSNTRKNVLLQLR